MVLDCNDPQPAVRLQPVDDMSAAVGDESPVGAGGRGGEALLRRGDVGCGGPEEVAAFAYLAYLAFTAVLVATPGATTAVVVRNTLAGGRPAGLAAALGAAAGNATHAVAAGLGLAVLVARSPDWLAAVRVIGALYLGWLGARSLVRAVCLHDGGLPFLEGGPMAFTPSDLGPSLREGLVVNLLNPAIVTFYLVAVPTFVPAGSSRGYYVLLAASHVLMALLFHAAWAAGLDRVRRSLARPMARRWLEGVTGTALVVLAAIIVTRR